ncbi:hypothetical protein ILFOPFJJ_06034 [Ensifer psoraleae]|nr:hypothetical protein [Sinorhizobium psoraleae]
MARAATARRSCALTRTSSSGAFFCTCSRTASTACATSAFSPIATDAIGSVSAESSLTNHHHQRDSRRPPSHSTGRPINAPTAGVPCAGPGSPSRLFHRRGHHLSGAIRHDVQHAEHWPIPTQNHAPFRRAIPLGPGQVETPSARVHSAKIAANRPAIGLQGSPDHAKIRRCDCRPRRIRYRHQAACSTIPIAATNNPRLPSIWLM